MQKGLVSIIIPHYNGISFLEDCLKSVLKTSYKPIEIIVVDNGSSDGSVAFVRKHFPSVLVLESPVNLGYAGGCTFGFTRSKGEFVVFLNNDATVAKQWLGPLVKACQRKDIAVCQPKILAMRKPTHFEYAGAAGGYMDIYGYPFCRGRIFDQLEEDKGQYDQQVPIFWASGACLFARRSFLEEADCYDAKFFMYYEEEDLCWRAHLRGYKVLFVPDSKVYHYGEKTASRFPFKKFYYFHRNHTLLLLKNYSWLTLLQVLPTKLLLDFIMVPYFLLHLHWKRAAAIVLSQFWLLLHPFFVLRERQQTQRLRKISDASLLPLLYPRSLAVSYFLRRKKQFKDYYAELAAYHTESSR